MSFEIRKKLDPILRESTEPVTDFGFEFQKTVDEMVETMRKKNGVGLAAPQVGISKKLLVCEFEDEKDESNSTFPLTVLCNPEIYEYSKEKINIVEGCLSFPGIELLVKRPKAVKVKAQDRYGNKIEIEADKLFARVIQHEVDHLNSTLFIDHLQEINIIFIGTGTLGLESLKMLSKDIQYKISAVITSDFETSGRNKATNPIYDLAKELHLPIIKTKNINDPVIIEKIKSLKPDLGVMADFGQIIKKEILDIPKHGIINIHPSLLPKHRGPSPIVQTILDGDKETGVTIILTSPKMDAGGIISSVIVEIPENETSETLKTYLGEIGGSLLMNTIPYYISGDLPPLPQDENNATFSKMIAKEDGFVDENTPALLVERKIRAYGRWPKVYIKKDNKRVQLLASHFNEHGNLIIDLVKPEGKNEMTYQSYLRGYKKEIVFKNN